MNAAQALARAQRNIRYRLRHAHYDETIRLRKLYLQLITGEDITDLLPQFERREDRALWEQRIRITIENLSPAVAPILNHFYKVSRARVREEIKAASEAQTAILRAAEADFYEQSDVRAYLTQHLDDYAFFDPNAFLVVDFRAFDPTGRSALPERPESYPVLYDCHEVLDFVYTPRGILDYLFVRIDFEIEDPQRPGQLRKAHDYYIYHDGGTIRFAEEWAGRELPDGVSWTVPEATERYRVIASTWGGNFVQAKRIGYLKHKKKRTICVSPLHPAVPLLKDLIRHKSGYDISILLHIFPKLFQYGEDCPGEVETNEAYVCKNGTIAGTRRKCSKCNGLGFKPHRSAQDVIYVKYPKGGRSGANDYVPLKDLAFYLSPDIGAVDRLDKELDKLERKIKVAVFGTDLNQRTTLADGTAQSATEIVVSKDNINNTLKPFGAQRGALYRFIVLMMAAFNDIDAEVVFEYNDRFETDSVEELLAKLKAFRNAQVNELLIDDVETQLALAFLENDPEGQARYLARRKFLPFRGKTPEAIVALLESDHVGRFSKVLYANFGEIFTAIENAKDGRDFYGLPFEAMFERVKGRVDALIELLESEAPATPTFALGRGSAAGRQPAGPGTAAPGGIGAPNRQPNQLGEGTPAETETAEDAA